MTTVIQRAWASIIGLVSITIALLTFSAVVHIPTLDALLHLVTGVFFIAGAWIKKGHYVSQANRWLGILYIAAGALGVNWPHIVAGIVTLMIGLLA